MSGVWDSFHPTLKRLLASDIVIRTCEGMADILVVLYVTNVSGITIPKYGVLVAIQLMTAILIYVPSARIAARVGRKPFVIATFSVSPSTQSPLSYRAASEGWFSPSSLVACARSANRPEKP